MSVTNIIFWKINEIDIACYSSILFSSLVSQMWQFYSFVFLLISSSQLLKKQTNQDTNYFARVPFWQWLKRKVKPKSKFHKSKSTKAKWYILLQIAFLNKCSNLTFSATVGLIVADKCSSLYFSTNRYVIFF